MLHAASCPADANPMPWLWEHNKHILDELREVTEPLTGMLDACIEADLAEGMTVLGETKSVPVQYDIPFGVPYTLLPPRFFSELYAGGESPRLPQEEQEARRLVAAYAQRCQGPPLPGMPEGAYTYTHQDRMGHILDDLVRMARRNVTIDPATWERYRRVAREQAEGGRYDMDIISVSRGNSIKSLYHYPVLARLAHEQATGAFNSFMMMPTAALDIDGHSFGLLPVGYLFMPVGAYGQEFSEKLLRTCGYVINSAQRSLGEQAYSLAEAHPEIVAKHMTRGRDGRPLGASLITTVQEGVRSVMEVVALLTADKIPGYDDPDQLLHALADQGVIETFTRAIPMGMLGPLVFSGKYFPGLLINKGSGKLALNASIVQEIKQAKRAMAHQDMAAWAVYWAASEQGDEGSLPPVATSLICPAAMPYGALWQVNKTIVRAYDKLSLI